MSDERGQNWRGYPELRARAKEFRKSQTSAEERLWKALRGRKVDRLKFRRQHPIDRVIVDFCCVDLKLVVEVDGSVHQTIDQATRDRVRDEWLAQEGYKVIRVKNDDVESDLVNVLAAIQREANLLSLRRDRL